MKNEQQNYVPISRGKSGAALLFPGMGYHHDKPLLYYAGKLLAQGEILTIKVDYGPLPSGKENLPGAVAQVQRRVEQLAQEEDWGKFERLILIGKSVGTVASGYFGQLLRQRGIVLGCSQIIYTPVAETLPFLSEHSVVFSGTADQMVDQGRLLSACRDKKSELHLFEAANHSLETGDVMHDLEILREVMEITKRRIVPCISESSRKTCENTSRDTSV